jgi:hypothetical protein
MFMGMMMDSPGNDRRSTGPFGKRGKPQMPPAAGGEADCCAIASPASQVRTAVYAGNPLQGKGTRRPAANRQPSRS